MPDLTRQERFLRLLEANERILWKVAGAYTRTAADREDLVQEMAAQLWRSFERYDERFSFSTWMYRVALNVAITAFRGESRRWRHLVPAEPEHLEAAAPGDGSDGEDERLAPLREAMLRLGAPDRALLILHLDGNRYETIAEILGISESNVGTRLGRIRQKLRRDLVGARP